MSWTWFQRHWSGFKVWIGFLAGLVLLWGLRIQAFAASNTPSNALQGFYSVTGGQALTQNGIITKIATVTQDGFAIITAAAAGFGMIFIVWGGITMIHGGAMKKQEGMERIKNAVIGLVIALAAGFITAVAAFFAGTFS
ncbi:pilin [Alicyclobacillus tolerans]|uniref:pilin n=1 Tax=Alicyclobacillus tolerans TaxID=90970 RepID=UPI001F268742|nr:pilin [Alicyclobacillus tolerans]MCF8567033.1 pilin [Alicyclobacillus tolerans]